MNSLQEEKNNLKKNPALNLIKCKADEKKKIDAGSKYKKINRNTYILKPPK